MSDRLSREILRRKSYALERFDKYVSASEPPIMIRDHSYEAILDLVNKKFGRVFFLDAPGETGKTFVINLFLTKS